jgi:lysophospholipase L1-like esterase
MRGRLSMSAGVVVTAVVLALIGAQPVSAGDGWAGDDGRNGSGHHQRQDQYLALGDSLPFGFNPLLVDPTMPTDPTRFVGYPELAAPQLRLALTNASCPGQTSAGFISLDASDNGCNAARAAGLPLHVAYTGTQLDFALSFLQSNPNTGLVTLDLGANDLFLCGHDTAIGCASDAEFSAALAVYGQNLATILTAIRGVYDGKLVDVTYYSTNYDDTQVTNSTAALNAVTTQVIDQFNGTVADGFEAFAAATDAYGGDTCAAGLLIPLPSGGCDVHPSEAGAQLLADTLVAAVSCDPAYRDLGNRDDSLVAANG